VRVSQEQKHDQHHKADADRHGHLHLINRGSDRLGSIPHDLQLDRRWKIALKLRQRGLHKLDRLVDVEPELLVYVYDDNAPAAQPCRFTNSFGPFNSFTEVADPYRMRTLVTLMARSRPDR
jgi:hypothetical protein